MEDLVSSSSFRSVLSCSEGQAHSVESSWTDYFVDFMLSEEEKIRQDASYHATDAGEDGGADGGKHGDEEEEDSMISDAASRPPAVAALLPTSKRKELKKLKKKAFKALDDEEDTASSPVNSPKVSVLSQMEVSPKKRCSIRDLSTKEDGIGHGDQHRMEGMDCTDATMEGARLFDPDEMSIAPCAELKDKGFVCFRCPCWCTTMDETDN